MTAVGVLVVVLLVVFVLVVSDCVVAVNVEELELISAEVVVDSCEEEASAETDVDTTMPTTTMDMINAVFATKDKAKRDDGDDGDSLKLLLPNADLAVALSARTLHRSMQLLL